MRTQAGTIKNTQITEIMKKYSKKARMLLVCGLSLPLFAACGMPVDQKSALDSQSAYYDNLNREASSEPAPQSNGSQAGTSGHAGTSVDFSSSNPGCKGFNVRSKPETTDRKWIAVSEKTSDGRVVVTPLQTSEEGTLSVGQRSTFSSSVKGSSNSAIKLSMEGNSLYAIYPKDENKYVLERRSLQAEGSQAQNQYIIRNTTPLNLKAYNGYAYYTDSKNVHVVDLKQRQTPHCQMRSSSSIDLPKGVSIKNLARNGKTLVTISNLKASRYAIFYKVDARGWAQPRYGAELFYREGIQYHRTAVNNDFLVVYGTYKKNGRTGHLLSSFQLQSEALFPVGNLEVQAPESKSGGAWSGLAVIQGHVIVSSKDKGIQIFEKSLSKETRKTVEFDGVISDLMVQSDVAYALTQTSKGSVIKVLRWDSSQQTLYVASSHPVSGKPTQFIR